MPTDQAKAAAARNSSKASKEPETSQKNDFAKKQTLKSKPTLRSMATKNFKSQVTVVKKGSKRGRFLLNQDPSIEEDVDSDALIADSVLQLKELRKVKVHGTKPEFDNRKFESTIDRF